MRKWLSITVIIALMLISTACQGADNDADKDNNNSAGAEATESVEVDDEEEYRSPSPEYDANGNPTGEYAQYLWEQEQMEEAKKSMAEDAMREYYEDMYVDDHSGGFPLD